MMCDSYSLNVGKSKGSWQLRLDVGGHGLAAHKRALIWLALGLLAAI